MSPRRPSPTPRRAISVRLPLDVIEALDETADELIVSRNVLVEHAVVDYLRALTLPERTP